MAVTQMGETKRRKKSSSEQGQNTDDKDGQYYGNSKVENSNESEPYDMLQEPIRTGSDKGNSQDNG